MKAMGWQVDTGDGSPDYSHGEDDGKNVDDAGKKKRWQDACAQEVRQAGNLFIKIYFSIEKVGDRNKFLK